MSRETASGKRCCTVDGEHFSQPECFPVPFSSLTPRARKQRQDSSRAPLLRAAKDPYGQVDSSGSNRLVWPAANQFGSNETRPRFHFLHNLCDVLADQPDSKEINGAEKQRRE